MRMKSFKLMKKALVHVLGCKVNQAEAASMAAILENRGYHVASNVEDPDLVVVNTCCVTSKAEAKSRRAVGRLAARFPRAKLIVTGCLAEVNPASLERVAAGHTILSTFEKDRFQEFLTDASGSAGERDRRAASSCTTFMDLGAPGIPGRARAFLKVQDGCSQHCSYCIVPRARGPSRSLSAEKVMAHAHNLSGQGYGEIVLTGIHLGNYGMDLPQRSNLESLVENLLDQCPDVRFRLSSIEPQEITLGLIGLAARHPRFCKHFHIPLQSGDDAILKRMRRPYDSAMIMHLTETIREMVPDACIGMDVMVGFPGEDDRAFQQSVDTILGSVASYLHVFPFSPRPGTPAANFGPRVAEKEIQERVNELRRLSRDLRIGFYKRFLGRTLIAVVESGTDDDCDHVNTRTDNYIPVRVPRESLPPEIKSFEVTLERMLDDEVLGICPSGGMSHADLPGK